MTKVIDSSALIMPYFLVPKPPHAKRKDCTIRASFQSGSALYCYRISGGGCMSTVVRIFGMLFALIGRIWKSGRWGKIGVSVVGMTLLGAMMPANP